jgi:hypothetical protein
MGSQNCLRFKNRMGGQNCLRFKIRLATCVPAIRLQQLSLAFLKCFSLVSASFSHFFNLINDQAASEYSFDIEHAYSSSNEASACSVEPGSAEDVAEIVS